MWSSITFEHSIQCASEQEKEFKTFSVLQVEYTGETYCCNSPINACEVVLKVISLISIKPGSLKFLILCPSCEVQQASKHIYHESQRIQDTQEVDEPHGDVLKERSLPYSPSEKSKIQIL